MSRKGQNGFPLNDIRAYVDPGGRGGYPLGATDGYTSAVVALASQITQGDLIVLIHTTTVTGGGIGQPNNNVDSNPWLPVLTTSGAPVNFVASGPTGGVRVRLWYRFATFADAVADHLTVLTNSTRGGTALSQWILPRLSMPADPQYENGDFGNSGPTNYRPTVVGLRTAASGNPYAPAITTPDFTSRFRNTGLIGYVIAYADNSKTSVRRNLIRREDDGFLKGQTIQFEQGGGASKDTGYRVPERPGEFVVEPLSDYDAVVYTGWRQQTLDGKPSAIYNNWSTTPGYTRLNDAFIAMTLAIVQPYQYPSPTPGRSWADLRTDFEPPTDINDKWHLGTTRSDEALPDLVDGKLRLKRDQQLLGKFLVDFTGQSLIVGPIEYDDAIQAGNNLYITLTITIDDIHSVQIAMFTNPSANGADILWSLIDDGYYALPVDDVYGRTRVGIWHPEKTKYWRIRESQGTLAFETSPDLLRWTGVFWGHELLRDQLAAMRPHFYVLGDGEVKVGGVNPPVQVDNREIPYESSWEFMGAPVALRERLHGRDVLVGIADQGSTAAVRQRQGVTMLRRNYIVGTPPKDATGVQMEIFPYATHGCLVTPCGVPIGGKFVEAVISGTDGSSSASMIMAGILWCARQGAKSINLSFGGGGDEPVFAQVFSYIGANFDTDVSIAAGNNYRYGIELPAAYASVFDFVHSVIAWDEETNVRASFSNHHELGSGAAPGNYVGGRLPDGNPVRWRGTSAASPHRANLAARLQTGRRFTAAQAGKALDDNARPTGQPASEQGGGAYDLGRAYDVIGDPTGTSNLPTVAMPRFVSGEWADVAERLNIMVNAVEHQGITCLLRYRGRSGPNDPADRLSPSVASGAYGVIPWNECEVDSYGGMWDGSPIIQIPENGLYLVMCQVRYGLNLNNDTNPASNSAYYLGSRGAVVLVNGTDLLANAIAVDRTPANPYNAVVNYGDTCLVAAAVQLYRDDWLYAQTWQNSGSAIQCCQDNYGGNFFGVTRLAPLAPTFDGVIAPVTNLTGTSIRYDQISLGWTHPVSEDVMSYLIRRKLGTTAPSTITPDDGSAFVATVDKSLTRYINEDLKPNTTYSYTVWARYPSGYSAGVSVTTTTSVKPAVPAPVSTITSTRRTSGVITLAWTVPPNPDGNGVPRAGIIVRRNEGYVAPTTPEGGTLLATLPPDATGFEDTNVVANGQPYAYSVFTYRAEQVYSVPVTHLRSTAKNTTMYAKLRPGMEFSDTFFHPSTPTRTPTLPTITDSGYYGFQLVALFFWVLRPAVFKGFRFLRPQPNIGRVKASLWEWEADPVFDVNGKSTKPYAYRRSPDAPFGTSASYVVWEETVLPEYVTLTPRQIYMSVTAFPSSLFFTSNFFTDETPDGWAPLGLMDPTGLLKFGGGDKVDSWRGTLGAAWPNHGNMLGSAAVGDQYFPEDYDGPIPYYGTTSMHTRTVPGTDTTFPGPGPSGVGRNYMVDVIVNEE